MRPPVGNVIRQKVVAAAEILRLPIVMKMDAAMRAFQFGATLPYYVVSIYVYWTPTGHQSWFESQAIENTGAP
jgi:hypothetical protein